MHSYESSPSKLRVIVPKALLQLRWAKALTHLRAIPTLELSGELIFFNDVITVVEAFDFITLDVD